MSRRGTELLIAVPAATFIAYLVARTLLNDEWQKFVHSQPKQSIEPAQTARDTKYAA